MFLPIDALHLQCSHKPNVRVRDTDFEMGFSIQFRYLVENRQNSLQARAPNVEVRLDRYWSTFPGPFPMFKNAKQAITSDVPSAAYGTPKRLTRLRKAGAFPSKASP